VTYYAQNMSLLSMAYQDFLMTNMQVYSNVFFTPEWFLDYQGGVRRLANKFLVFAQNDLSSVGTFVNAFGQVK